MEKFQNYIDGKWCEAISGATFENRNPADWSDLIGTFPKSGLEDVDRAINAAQRAYREWRLTPAPARGNILKRAGDLLVERKDFLAREMTREMGKVLKETRGDVQEGIDTAYYAASETRRLFGMTAPSELPNKFNLSMRQPHGVCGIITPWNFPMAIPAWKIFPALACGNTVVFKPASNTPRTATELAKILAEAGVPKGVVNLVHGGGGVVGNAFVNDHRVAAISFTGSSEVGKHINELAGKMLKRVSLELGGKNGLIVMNDADLDTALDAVLWGAFGTTGQRCTATSRIILQSGIHDKFLKMLVEAATALKLGNGLDERNEVGPCVSESQRDTVHQYTLIGMNEDKAKLECGGKFATGGELDKGWFYQPTIFSGVKPGMRIEQEEIFGPVLSVVKVETFDEAIAVLNDTVYGLSSSIFTRDVNAAMTAARDIEAGIVYINSATIGAECHMPFGGVKETGNGHREGGWTVFDFFSEWKTVYVDFSGKLQKAQIDTN